MKIAVTYEKETGNIFQHFGKTQFFKIYQIEYGKIVFSEVIDNGGNGHHALPPYLKSLGGYDFFSDSTLHFGRKNPACHCNRLYRWKTQKCNVGQ